ncbi:MAG: hypothetical protein RBG13Loki_3258 [Promethearchaeota archaeon CR_4]|nr:MAG: hypothetical protein RBG13Loki_3258 [Candidatus Lokiarchaeota archaeon CR_4]
MYSINYYCKWSSYVVCASQKIEQMPYPDDLVCVVTGSDSPLYSDITENEVEMMRFPACLEGNVSESSIIDAILARYERAITEERDLCVEGSFISIELLRSVKTGTPISGDIVRNSLLLILALFYPREKEDDIMGVDVTCLPARERQDLIQYFEANIPTYDAD